MIDAPPQSRVRPWTRRATRAVPVGPIRIGGDTPVVVQSMTVSNTADTAATAAEVMALARAGCHLVRITTPSRKEAQNLGPIKEAARKLGVTVPLVADVHFTPNAALDAAEFVEKVRINPGNYADRKQFKIREYTDAQYEDELVRLEEAFLPLVEKAKERRVALRIGTNHGSLSDRILNRFGDTPLGMAESALEFVRICRSRDFHDLVLSAKASNVRVMVESYRILATMMHEQGMDYPLHLGVTEAGDGEDGRIKSAVGIGTLLLEGLGDTIRVSLTEDPIHEVPVCRDLLDTVEAMVGESARPELWDRPAQATTRRRSHSTVMAGLPIGDESPPRVMLQLPGDFQPEVVRQLLDQRPSSLAEMAPEGFEVATHRLSEARHALELSRRRSDVPLLVRTSDLALARAVIEEGGLLSLDIPMSRIGQGGLSTAVDLAPPIVTFVGGRGGLAETADVFAQAGMRLPVGTLLAFETKDGPVLRTEGYRALAATTRQPLLLRATAGGNVYRTAMEIGSLLVDGIGDVVLAGSGKGTQGLQTLYNILQATGARITKTEYISCPSCGRTFFDLETTTARIKAKTAHLKGVKIAVMGCIVNGPGEMADADFGYVGASPGTVHLFVGKDLIERSIPAAEADARLIELIKSRGRWVDPPVPAEA